MTFEDIIRSPRLRALGRAAPLGPYIDDFVTTVSATGYTPTSLRDLLQGVIQFGTFLREQGVTDLQNLQARHVEAFIATQPLRRCRGQYVYPISRGVRGARHLWCYAQAAGITAVDSNRPSSDHPVLEAWLAFLERHRGLAKNSLALYRRHIQRFLDELGPQANGAKLRSLNAERVRDYISRAVHGYSRSHRKAVVSTLRIFLRFAWERGYVERELATTVERIPSFKHETTPRGPCWEDAQRLLDVPDRSTTLGQRDYAILQILLSYGVRAQQVCSLKLQDLSWPTDTIRFAPMKGGRGVEVPLTPTVGEAVLAYLRAGRPQPSASRHVFLRSRAPFRPITTSAISGLVTKAFVQAGVASPHRGSHALRHAWATHLLAEGRSFKTIADLLGHRSLETTRIYAKVDVRRLRTVGLSWPQEVHP